MIIGQHKQTISKAKLTTLLWWMKKGSKLRQETKRSKKLLDESIKSLKNERELKTFLH